MIALAIFGFSQFSTDQSPQTAAVVASQTDIACVEGSLTASGSTALAPLAQKVAQQYQKQCPDTRITINLGGSGTGLTNVMNGVSDIANSDIFSKPGQEGLVDHQVAVVIFGLMVNDKVQVDSLTTEQIKGIYAGTVTNWGQVGGNDLPIVVISRPPSSGTRATFQNYVLGGPETISGPSRLTSDSNGTVIKNVRQTAGAIGYAGTGPIKEAGLKTLKINDVEAIAANVADGSYPYWNIEHMYTKGPASALAQSFIDYVMSDASKPTLLTLDFVPISDISPQILATHQQQ